MGASILLILYPAPTLSHRCVGCGRMSSHHQRALRGKWYSGAWLLLSHSRKWREGVLNRPRLRGVY